MKKVIYRVIEDDRESPVIGIKNVYEAFHEEIFGGELREKLVVFFVSNEARIVGYEIVGIGHEKSLQTSIKSIFRSAIHVNAEGIILAHNHPNNSLRFSKEDIDLTKTVRKAGNFLGILLFDHYLFTDDGCLSLSAFNREEKGEAPRSVIEILKVMKDKILNK